jgi:hypothetical protein
MAPSTEYWCSVTGFIEIVTGFISSELKSDIFSLLIKPDHRVAYNQSPLACEEIFYTVNRVCDLINIYSGVDENEM